MSDKIALPNIKFGHEVMEDEVDALGAEAIPVEITPNSKLSSFVQEQYQEAKEARTPKESGWLSNYRAWRGEYSPEEQERINKMREVNPGAAAVFVKITKTKVTAAYGQILEVLFPGKKFPITVEPTPIPEGIEDVAFLADEETADALGEDIYGFEGDGRDIKPGTDRSSLLNVFDATYRKLFGNKKLIPGVSPDKNTFKQIHPAMQAAKKMEKVIHDQLEESYADLALRHCALEQVIFGTGCIKGPYNYKQTMDHYEQDPETKEIFYKPYTKLVPKISACSIWNLYPADGTKDLQEADYVVERHILNKHQLRQLRKLKFVDREALARVLESSGMRETEGWEDSIKDTNKTSNIAEYEVLEYWGYLDSKLAKELELIDESAFEDGVDEVQINALVSGNEVLKVVLNPFTPQRIPYYAVPYEQHPYQIWGIGVPENMSDTQELMNGHMRMAIDNLRLAGNVVFEVNETWLSPNQDLIMHPGKVIRTSGPPGQAIHGITFPNTSQSHMYMVDQVRRFMDESTGIPSYSHGATGVTGTTRTASGMSMLMAASALNIKTVIKNIDHYLLKPLGRAYYQWNMQFNSDNVEIRGDMQVVAGGTASIMQREVLTQRLLSWIQIAQQSPLFNAQYAFEELAKSMDLDPDKAVNDPQIAQLYAELIQKTGGANGPQANGQTGGEAGGIPSAAGQSLNGISSTGGINPADITGAGGGNIGFGAPSMPSEPTFSQ